MIRARISFGNLPVGWLIPTLQGLLLQPAAAQPMRPSGLILWRIARDYRDPGQAPDEAWLRSLPGRLGGYADVDLEDAADPLPGGLPDPEPFPAPRTAPEVADEGEEFEASPWPPVE